MDTFSKRQRRLEAERLAIRKGMRFGRMAIGVGAVSIGVGIAVLCYALMWAQDIGQGLLFASVASTTLIGAIGRYYLEQQGRKRMPASIWNRAFADYAA